MSREPFTDEDSSPSAGLVASAVDMLVAYLPAIMAHPGKRKQVERLYLAIMAEWWKTSAEPPALPEINTNEDLA